MRSARQVPLALAVTVLLAAGGSLSGPGHAAVAQATPLANGPVRLITTQVLANSVARGGAGVIDEQGRFYLAGTVNDDFGVGRINRDAGGGGDEFGYDTIAITDFGGDDVANAVALGADVRVVAAGSSRGDVAVAQYTPVGDLDQRFGVWGRVTADLGGVDDAAYGVAVLSDFKVLVAAGNSSGATVLRLNPDGSPDSTFANGGRAALGTAGPARGIAAYPDGRAVVVSGEGDRLQAMRLLPDGTLDPAFGQAGTVTVVLGAGTTGRGVAFAADGGIVIAGGHAGDIVVARFTDSGEPDIGFAAGGVVIHDVGSDEAAAGVSVDVHGVIWVAGERSAGGGFISSFRRDGEPNFEFADRLTPNRPKSIDTGREWDWVTVGEMGDAFGYDTGHGVLGDWEVPALGRRFGFGADHFATGGGWGPRAEERDMVLQPDGKMVVVGNFSGETALMRHHTDGTLDTAFGKAGRMTSDVVADPVGIAILPSGSIVVAGTARSRRPDQGWRAQGAIAAFLPDGTSDLTFGDGGRTLLNGVYDTSPTDLTLVAGSRIVAATQQRERGVVLWGLTADGRLDPGFGDGGIRERAAPYGDGVGGRVESDGNGLFVFGLDDGVHRMHANGTPDAAFGTGGAIRVVGGAENPGAVGFGPDGRVLVAGWSGAGWWVGRFLPDGQHDPTWEQPVKPSQGDLSNFDPPTALAVQGDGRVLATSGGAVVRFQTNGLMDPTFGIEGQALTTRLPHGKRAFVVGRWLYVAGGYGTDEGFELDRIAVDVPARTTVSRIVAGNAALRVTWTPPPTDPDKPVTGYQVTVRSGNETTTTVGGQTTSMSLTGLVNGRGYAFSVRAFNASGLGFAPPPDSSGSSLASPVGFHASGLNSLNQLGRSGPNNLPNARGDGIHSATVVSLSAGGFHSLSAATDGTVRSWGWNGFGQLGTPTVGSADYATPVPGVSGVTAVAAGMHHSLALRADGTVWAWGWNAIGQLGDGTATDRHAPVQVRGLSGVVAISAGTLHSLAVRADGTVWAWGWNGAGQLGDGGTVNRLVPGLVPGLGSATSVSAGIAHSLAVRSDGSVWGWGWNAMGQVGDGTTTDRWSPVRVPGVAANRVSAGAAHSLALTKAGTVAAWGWNADGQLGDRTTFDRRSPVPVPGLASVTEVSAGGLHSMAVDRTETVYSWGSNRWGQLGRAGPTDRAVVVASPESPSQYGATFSTRVAAGLAHSLDS